MFEFVNRAIYGDVFVVGCGGTGSRLAPMLIQFLKTLSRPHNPSGWLENPKIYFVDDDIVEQKNLVRQNFIEQDVGQPKAVVLADRYSRAFGMEIYPIVKKIGPVNTYSKNGREWYREDDNGFHVPGNAGSENQLLSLSGALVILCVDSARARRDILHVIRANDAKFFQEAKPTFVIDAGNEDDFGQVRFFTHTWMFGDPGSTSGKLKMKPFPKPNPFSMSVNRIPFPKDYYDNLGESRSEKSCADLDQTLAINAIMATSILGIVQNLYLFRPMTYDGVRISLNGGNATEYNTPDRWFSRAVSAYDSNFASGKIDGPNLLETYYNGASSLIKSMGMKMDEKGNVIPIKSPLVQDNPPPLTSIKQQQDKEADTLKKSRTARKKPAPMTATPADMAVYEAMAAPVLRRASTPGDAPELIQVASAVVPNAPVLTPITRTNRG